MERLLDLTFISESLEGEVASNRHRFTPVK
jgi:hypothetical protein